MHTVAPHPGPSCRRGQEERQAHPGVGAHPPEGPQGTRPSSPHEPPTLGRAAWPRGALLTTPLPAAEPRPSRLVRSERSWPALSPRAAHSHAADTRQAEALATDHSDRVNHGHARPPTPGRPKPRPPRPSDRVSHSHAARPQGGRGVPGSPHLVASRQQPEGTTRTRPRQQKGRGPHDTRSRPPAEGAAWDAQ